MRGTIIAGRYAKALFDIGAESGTETLQHFKTALASLTAAAKSSPELGSVLRSPVFTHVEKEQALFHVLAVVMGAMPEFVSQTVKNFCGLLAEKNRLTLFPLIAEAFSAMLDAHQAVVRGGVCTAIELDANQQATVKERLEKTVTGTLNLEYQVDPAILGGITLKLGNRMLDASLRTQLEMLRDTIKKGE